MTMVPIWKTCPFCGKMYSWNPDVGNMFCPRCSNKDEKSIKVIGIIFKQKNKDK